uniref:PCI domain-containing protein n=1 Tax=Elaeophora elaphi TaxID=1147741 RepID=A0A0R3RQD3_9BILA
MVEVHLSNFRNAVNAEEVAQQIYSLVEASDIYAFAQFLAEPSVQALQKDPNYFKYYNLLYLFAYGTYGDSVARKNDLPELNETMLLKLRQLTLVTMCTRSKIFLIKDAMRELHISDLQEFQRLFISAVYDGIIQGRLNAQKNEVEVFSWKNRDISDEELDNICRELHKWIQRCTDIKGNLTHVAKLTEKAIAEANERENKVAEEAKKVQKMLEEEEEQRMPKEFYRRTKTQRGKKHC